MSLLTGFVSSLLFITTAYTLTPPRPNPAPNTPSLSTPSNLRLLNLSSVPDQVIQVNDDSRNPRCKGQEWGYNLNQQSCSEAWGKMPIDSEIFHYGKASDGHFERFLPYRYLSGQFEALYSCINIIIFC